MNLSISQIKLYNKTVLKMMIIKLNFISKWRKQKMLKKLYLNFKEKNHFDTQKREKLLGIIWMIVTFYSYYVFQGQFLL